MTPARLATLPPAAARARKDPDFVVLGDDPLNGGPSLARLGASFVTPAASFFVRDHGSIPVVDPAAYRLRVEGLVRRPLELSLDEIRSGFAWREIEATLQCAGNRRAELSALKPTSSDLTWDAHAIGNGHWSGVALAAILSHTELLPGAEHVAFVGLDEVAGDEDHAGFGGSIPIEKAVASETIVALELDGMPLPPEHGFPARAIVPGYIGARSVKWLRRIEVLAEPSHNPFHARDYRMRTAADVASGAAGIALGEALLNAAIVDPAPGTVVAPGVHRVRGYATPSHGREVARVEVSADGGITWTLARLTRGGPWAWTLWDAEVFVDRGCAQLIVRASDGGADQPQDVSAVWNAAGYMNNAWHRVPIEVGR